mmetsp:Transcript_50059/g.103417  ORF Transcript_50059/g.103417 Transcript_50059/m.103417 type:complete len:383 (+) Transcript_50059:1023-2171(+)
MKMELTEELGQKGKDAVFLFVLELIELHEELLDLGSMEAHLPLDSSSNIKATLCSRRHGMFITLHLVTIAWQPVHKAELHLRIGCLDSLQLLIKLRLHHLDLTTLLVVNRVRPILRPELQGSILAGGLDDAPTQLGDDGHELRQNSAGILRLCHHGKATRQRPVRREGGAQQLVALLVCFHQLHKVSKASGCDVIVHHRLAFRLQGVAPNPGGRTLQIHWELRDLPPCDALLQGRSQLLGKLVILQEVLHSLLAGLNILQIEKRRTNPLLQQSKTERCACVIQERQQGAFIPTFQSLNHFEGRQSRSIQNHALGVRASFRGCCKDVPSCKREQPLCQQCCFQVVHDSGSCDDCAVLRQRLLNCWVECLRMCCPVLVNLLSGV